MAKTVKGFEEDDFGNPVEYSHSVNRHQRKSARAGEIPWTRGPQTRWQKIKRAAIG